MCVVLTGGRLVEFSVPTNVIPEVASGQQIHHEVQILPVLEGIVHIDKKRVVLQFREDSALAHHGLDAPLRQDPRLAHFLHRKHIRMLGPLVLDLPHLAEASLADALLVLEEVLADSYQIKKVIQILWSRAELNTNSKKVSPHNLERMVLESDGQQNLWEQDLQIEKAITQERSQTARVKRWLQSHF